VKQQTKKEGLRKKIQTDPEQMDTDDIEVIDLCTPVNNVASVIETTNIMTELSLNTISTIQRTSYQSRTLTQDSEHHSILPCFPATNENRRPDLLLANVPGK